MTAHATRTLVVCPLEFECRLLRRAEIDRVCDLVVCGPGTHGIVGWAETAAVTADTVILAGLAGALGDAASPGGAVIVDRVVDLRKDHSWQPSITSGSGRPVTITSAEEAVTTPDARRALAAATGADLVDQESVGFARMAVLRGWRWAIVRGVSDGPTDVLPAGIDTWVDARGRSRRGRVLAALLRNPSRLPLVRRLRANAECAMRQAAALIRAVAQDAESASTLRTDIGRM